MEIKKLYIYYQNNNRNVYDIIDEFESGVVYPLKVNEPFLGSIGYIHVGVVDKKFIPKSTYFDGISNGFDCDCCGDRWERLWERHESQNVYIFDTFEEFEKHRYSINQYDKYCILEELQFYINK